MPPQFERLLRCAGPRPRSFLEIPTQICVVAATRDSTSRKRCAAGAPVDLVFQSIAGTRSRQPVVKAPNLAMLKESQARRALNIRQAAKTSIVLRDRTGALSANAHHGIDQQTCEARAYAVARATFRPLLVNTVVELHRPRISLQRKGRSCEPALRIISGRQAP